MIGNRSNHGIPELSSSLKELSMQDLRGFPHKFLNKILSFLLI